MTLDGASTGDRMGCCEEGRCCHQSVKEWSEHFVSFGKGRSEQSQPDT